MPPSGVSGRKLHELIEHEGFESLVPCSRCISLDRTCIRSEQSSRCAGCVRAGGRAKCDMPKESFTDAEWRRLLKFQSSLDDEEEAVLAKLLRLRKQKKLLKKRAGDFIAREYKEIAELEELERREAEELQRLEDERIESERKEREAESSRAATERIDHALSKDQQVLAATSEDPTLTQMIASVDPLPSLSWDDLDAFLSTEAAKSPSPVGGTVELAGGSPSGSR